MALASVVIAFFVFAVASDWLTIAYHRARESSRISRTSILSAALELITWLPILVAVTTNSATVWACAVASIVGSGLGTSIGMRRGKTPIS